VIRAIAASGRAAVAGIGFVELHVEFDCVALVIAAEDRHPKDRKDEAVTPTAGRTAGQGRSSDRDNCIAVADRDAAIVLAAVPAAVDLGHGRIFENDSVAAN